MKKILSLIMSSFLIISVSVLPSLADSPMLPGDADNNGVVNVADIIAIRNHILGTDRLCERGLAAADVNGIGVVNIFSMIAVRGIILREKSGSGKQIEPLSEEMEIRIKEDWVAGYPEHPDYTGSEYTIDKVEIAYYGTYNQNVAVMMFDNFYCYPLMPSIEEIAGVTFYYPDGNTILVWCDGDFIQLGSAYEQKLLTQEDLKNIGYYYNIKPTKPELASEMEQRIIEDFLCYISDIYIPQGEDRIWIEKYYGRYSGCEVIFMGGVVADDIERHIEIAEHMFRFGSSQSIHIYRDSTFMAIEDAYESGWITAEDVESIWKEHESRKVFSKSTDGILFEIIFDKCEYIIGDNINVTVRATNIGQEDVHTWDSSMPSNGMSLWVETQNGQRHYIAGHGLLTVIYRGIIQPGEFVVTKGKIVAQNDFKNIIAVLKVEHLSGQPISIYAPITISSSAM
ncbi:MAG: dockerin type I repeat-containing protein [Oscillospiraceae bacterium]|nr:dockerin type I repeat-containing protein [Oscillospiraceae bacterium]